MGRFGITLRHATSTFINYAFICIIMSNFGNSSHKISEQQAQEIIKVESQKRNLKNKNVTLVLFENDYLKDKNIGGIQYSYNDTSFIGFDKNNINITALYHELGHSKINKVSKNPGSLEQLIFRIENRNNIETSELIKRTIKYVISLEELYCNIQSIKAYVKK